MGTETPLRDFNSFYSHGIVQYRDSGMVFLKPEITAEINEFIRSRLKKENFRA